MSESNAAAGRRDAGHRRDRGLMAIGVFKLLEAIFFFLVGMGVIHFIHHDLGDAAARMAERLRINMGGRVMTWVFDHIDDLTAHRLKQIGAATFFYAGLRVTEGVGLLKEKAWAEYMTVGLTVSFLPWELYEICKRVDLFHVGILITNLIVLAYLLWVLRLNLLHKEGHIEDT